MFILKIYFSEQTESRLSSLNKELRHGPRGGASFRGVRTGGTQDGLWTDSPRGPHQDPPPSSRFVIHSKQSGWLISVRIPSQVLFFLLIIDLIFLRRWVVCNALTQF